MPTYTIIGATGKTGGALLETLLEHKDARIHAYVRSRQKLVTQHPRVDGDERVTVYEGGLTSVTALAGALTPHVDAAFCVTGSNESTPGMRIAQDTAQGVVAALAHARSEDPRVKLPRLIFLSSVTINPRIAEPMPAFAHWVVFHGLRYAYADLEAAERYMRLHESWLQATFVQPGALTEDTRKGHKVSLDACSSFISYLDLAAGMVEIADSGVYDWQGVSVQATGKDVRFEPKAPKQILTGFVWYLFPWLYSLAAYFHLA